MGGHRRANPNEFSTGSSLGMAASLVSFELISGTLEHEIPFTRMKKDEKSYLPDHVVCTCQYYII